MRTTIKAVAAGLTLIGSMALAAWAMADGAPKDDKGAVVELMHAILPKGAYDAMLDQMYTQMSASMQQAGGEGMTVGKKNALKAAVQESLPYDDSDQLDGRGLHEALHPQGDRRPRGVLQDPDGQEVREQAARPDGRGRREDDADPDDPAARGAEEARHRVAAAPNAVKRG